MRTGSALVLTLWAVAILSVMIVTLARLVDVDLEASSLASKRFEARELALTGIAYGMNPQIKRGDPLQHQRPDDGSALDVSVTSESARININSVLGDVNDETLADLFELWNVPEEFSRTAQDSLRDWIDENDIRSLNGAEREDLLGQTQYSVPENRDFISVEEMERVRGVDAIVLSQPNWAEVFSVHSEETLDVQDASSSVLQAVGGFSIEQAERLIETRNGPDGGAQTDDDLIFENLDQVASVIGLSQVQREALESRFGIGSEPTRVESVATVGGVSYTITVILDRGGSADGESGGNRGGEAKVLSWKEG